MAQRPSLQQLKLPIQRFCLEKTVSMSSSGLSAIVRTTLLDEGLFIGTDEKLSRPTNIEWPVPPEEIGRFSSFPSRGHAHVFSQILSSRTSFLPFPPVQYQHWLLKRFQPPAYRFSLRSILQRSYKSDPLYIVSNFSINQCPSHSIALILIQLKTQA